jgi:flavin-dependent dehydrogenase
MERGDPAPTRTGDVPDTDRPFDVAIAGAGLAGASLALRLARRGARVVLLDAATFPRDKLCGEYLSPESWGVLDRLGLAEQVADSRYQPIRRVRLTTPRGRILEADVAGPDGLPGIALSRSALDEMLVRRAQEAGAEVWEGARVGAPIVEDGRVVGLRARHPTRGSVEVHAKLTVAANGRHSALVRHTGAIRARSFARPRLFGMKRHLTVADSDAAEPAGTVGLHLVPGSYIGTCRVEGALTNLCGLLPESVPRRYRGDLDRLAAAEFRRNPVLARLWDAAVPAGEWKAVAGVRVEVSSPRLTGILYAGDCQGTVDPLGGQGMTMALLGAELLAPFVERGLVSGADAPLRRAYQAAWHRRFDRRIRLCRLFHHALVNPSLIDLLAGWRTLAPRVLAACFERTRDATASVRLDQA